MERPLEAGKATGRCREGCEAVGGARWKATWKVLNDSMAEWFSRQSSTPKALQLEKPLDAAGKGRPRSQCQLLQDTERLE